MAHAKRVAPEPRRPQRRQCVSRSHRKWWWRVEREAVCRRICGKPWVYAADQLAFEATVVFQRERRTQRGCDHQRFDQRRDRCSDATIHRRVPGRPEPAAKERITPFDVHARQVALGTELLHELALELIE